VNPLNISMSERFEFSDLREMWVRKHCPVTEDSSSLRQWHQGPTSAEPVNWQLKPTLTCRAKVSGTVSRSRFAPCHIEVALPHYLTPPKNQI